MAMENRPIIKLNTLDGQMDLAEGKPSPCQSGWSCRCISMVLITNALNLLKLSSKGGDFWSVETVMWQTFFGLFLSSVFTFFMYLRSYGPKKRNKKEITTPYSSGPFQDHRTIEADFALFRLEDSAQW